MIHPSYSELMEVVNSNVEEGEQPLVQSRYSIVKATSARAKQIIDARAMEEKLAKNQDKTSELPLTEDEERRLKLGTSSIPHSSKMKPLSLAVEELYEGKIKIVAADDTESQL